MSSAEKLRCPLTYWGGKQQLAGRIIDLLPEHEGYVEPFCGGAAVFWAKEPSKWEVLNDTNGELVNFYKEATNNFAALERQIRASLHSRDSYLDAVAIYTRPSLHSPVRRAWAAWVLSNSGFCGKLISHFGYDRSGQTSKALAAKRNSFTADLAIRLRNVQIESCDALRIIRSRDTTRTLFYCDPPYINSDQGHYDAYDQYDYESLLAAMAQIKGKFLLSSYPSKSLREATAEHGWHSIEIAMAKPSSRGTAKTEVLTANYPLT